MSNLPTLSASDLSSLLCSKVCHDIISPVGAINNGLELLDEGGADEDAMDLIRNSAINASARLQFARIAFGAAGSAGVKIDTGDAETVAKGWFATEKPELTWTCERALLPKAQIKLILNLLAVANASIPRGGQIDCVVDDATTDSPKVRINVTGKMKRIPQKFDDLLSGRPLEDGVDAHSVQFYYTILLAEEAGMTIRADMTDEEVIYTAQ